MEWIILENLQCILSQKKKRNAYASQMLENELFPHLGIITSKRERAMFLMLMLDKLIKNSRRGNANKIIVIIYQIKDAKRPVF